MEFKKGMKVRYDTGANRGTGEITEIRQSAKGYFYVVQDLANRAVFALRAAKLTPV